MANCSGNEITCWISSNVNIIANIANSLQPVQRMVSGMAYLIGLALIFKGVYCLKTYGEQRTMMSSQSNVKEPIAYFLVGAMMIYLRTGMQVLLNTTFGNTPYSQILAYAPVNSSNSTLDMLFGQGSAVGPSLAIIIQTIGIVAFVRGWVLIARSASHGQQPGGMGKGFVHVFGGILAMNIVGTLQIINNTLYGSS